MSRLWDWILSFFDKPVRLGAHCFMPLFLRGLANNVVSTWTYLALPKAEQKYMREQVKNGALKGETPAITFLLTPSADTGGLIGDAMLGITDSSLDRLEAECKALTRNGIAVFLCLYTDDKIPRWWQIERDAGIWYRVHQRVQKYVTGVILSGETNEEARTLSQIDRCLGVMRQIFSGVDFYGCHLQWRASNGQYQWHGGASTPANANIILVEFSWEPKNGDAAGVLRVKDEYAAINAAETRCKLVLHEFNLNPDGAIAQEQRAYLRQQGAWGVGG